MFLDMSVRVLGNGAVFVQYHEGGKSKDAAFMSWPEFIEWLTERVAPSDKPPVEVWADTIRRGGE
jgi:hypothetical protein